jgi:hypothetical protein
VFDNTCVVGELGRAPAAFSSYGFPLLRFARENHFRYPYRPWPDSMAARAPEPEAPAHAERGARIGAAGAGGAAP